MDTTDALQFILGNHRGVLIAYRQDGAVQASPVTASVDPEGHVVISSRETAFKVKHLQRDPRAAYCGFSDDFYGHWVQIEGTATIVHLPEALEPLVDYYRSVAGEHPDWDDYRAAMVRDQRVLIRIQVDRAGPDRAG
jgi:PPOX class probable F420-dependent enzyme